MTAEIVVMNQSAVAMAADSAVTITLPNGDKKIYNTSNKLFALSKYHPVGIMIYNSSKMMGVEWEIIIKEYRKRLGHNKFDSLDEYYHDFLSYLNTFEIFSKEIKDQNISIHIRGVLQMIAKEVDDSVKEKTKEKGVLIDDKITEVAIKETIDVLIGLVKDSPITNFSLEEFLGKYNAMIDEILKDDVKNIEAVYIEKIKIIIYHAIGSMKFYGGFTGVVICGYGEKEIFPSMINMMINGLGDGFAIFNKINEYKIGLDKRSAIIPFAQSEMVASFMDGIDPDYDSFIQRNMGIVFDNINSILPLASAQIDEIKEAFSTAMFDYKKENFIRPILKIVESLPKTDLAEMAEALVNLTSFKRHVSPDAETVGGPTDVAVISKADGLIWIKRKHYFDPALNQQFFLKYNMEGC